MWFLGILIFLRYGLKELTRKSIQKHLLPSFTAMSHWHNCAKLWAIIYWYILYPSLPVVSGCIVFYINSIVHIQNVCWVQSPSLLRPHVVQVPEKKIGHQVPTLINYIEWHPYWMHAGSSYNRLWQQQLVWNWSCKNHQIVGIDFLHPKKAHQKHLYIVISTFIMMCLYCFVFIGILYQTHLCFV